MKNRHLKRRKLNRMLDPNYVSVEEITKVLFFGNRTFQVPDELWESIIMDHLTDWHYN